MVIFFTLSAWKNGPLSIGLRKFMLHSSSPDPNCLSVSVLAKYIWDRANHSLALAALFEVPAVHYLVSLLARELEHSWNTLGRNGTIKDQRNSECHRKFSFPTYSINSVSLPLEIPNSINTSSLPTFKMPCFLIVHILCTMCHLGPVS